MWAQKIEYVDADVVLPSLVKKQVWDPDTQEFVPVAMYRFQSVLNNQKLDWLKETYGQPGVYKNGRFWNYSKSGNFTVMDEKVYMMYCLKWGNR